MQAPRTFTPSNPVTRELGQPDFPPGFSGHPLSRPPVQGFEPKPEDNRRKSSSTITTTTTTHEFGGPMAMAMTSSNSRSYNSMPVGRNSMPVPTPHHNQNGRVVRTPSYGSSTMDRPLSPQLESPSGQYNPQMQAIDACDGRNKRYSTMTTGTFGMRDRDQLESLAEYEHVNLLCLIFRFPTNMQPNSSIPASDGTRTPPRQPNTADSRTPPSSWLPAEAEKQRLYNEARARAANTQSQTGASMQDIGMDAPPDYDTPSRHTQLSSGTSSPVIPALVLTAAEEEEQQRKRYEAATDTGGSGSGSSSAPPPPSAGEGGRQPSYLSAAEEKEIHRKRYNDAVSRTGAGASIERTETPSGGLPWATLSAAEEKELQRKRYEEAAGRVGGGDGGHGSVSSRAVSPSPLINGSPIPTSSESPVPYDAIYGNQFAKGRATGPTQFVDGEAMNRYTDKSSNRIVSNPTSSTTSPLVLHARQRPTSMQVGSAPLNGSQARGERSIQQPTTKAQEVSPLPAGSSSSSRQLPAGGAELPIDEKAQMKRYYEALDKVNNAQSGSSSNPASYDQPPPEPEATPAPKASAYMSAAEEKEQMKKRFEEATSKVNQAQSPRMNGSGSGSGSGAGSGAMARAPPSAYPSAEEEKDQMRKRYEAATAAVGGSPIIPNGNGSVGGHSKHGSASSIPSKQYMSAAEEKEQMRKRFEDATAAVNRQSSQPPAAPARSGATGSGSGSGSGSAQAPASYMSAAEEKEQMRKRFEDATAAVNRQSSQPSSPRINGSGSGSGSGGSSQAPAGFMSAAEEKGQMRKRFESAQAAVGSNNPPPQRAPQTTRTLSTPIDPDAPPPPLPTRPPVEYITLLSPVNESERDRPPWSRNESFGAIGQGEGSGGK